MTVLKKILLALLCAVTFSQAAACETYIDGELHAWAEIYAHGFGIDPDLVVAVVWQESKFCTQALGDSGEVGLGQFMPGTAREVGIDPSDPKQNLWGTSFYLRQQYQTFGDWELALAAYNAGARRVRSGQIPKSTVEYVASVLRIYESLKRSR